MDSRPCVAVAASGGRDSTALLHCTLRQAGPLGLRVLALHVHHGLQPQADDWLAQVRAQARRWGATFMVTRLDGGVPPGDSLEAWARRERYAALAAMAREAGCGTVLLAHHRRDQAETVWLQALRGGGAAGLSAMPQQIEREGLVWLRPWLAQPREAIEAYVRRHRLRWVDDTSNADPRHARNRLRLKVWPALTAAFPDVEVALAQVAQRAQDAAAILAEVSAADLQLLARPDGSLDAVACLALPPPRRREALRRWLQRVVPAPVPETLVLRLADELPVTGCAGSGAGIRSTGRWPAGAGELRLYRGRLHWVADGPTPRSVATLPAMPPSAPLAGAPTPVLDLSKPGRHPVPGWRGHWLVQPVVSPAESAVSTGIAAAQLCQVQMRPRAGGERFQATPGGLPRSLKKQFQAAAVPAWARGAPLLFAADGSLLYVPGLGLDARQWTRPGPGRLSLAWVPDDSPA